MKRHFLLFACLTFFSLSFAEEPQDYNDTTEVTARDNDSKDRRKSRLSRPTEKTTPPPNAGQPTNPNQPNSYFYYQK